MYKISLVSSSITIKEEVKEQFNRLGSDIDIYPKEVPISQLVESDGIILEERSSDDLGYICSLIFSIKEKKGPFIWVLSNQKSQINAQVLLQLGINGVLDSAWFPEEVALTVRNTFNHFEERDERNVRLEKEISKEKAIKMLPESQSVRLREGQGERVVELTRLESNLLNLLVNSPTQVCSYEYIHQQLWNRPYNNNRYRIANMIFHLRNKLDKSGQSSYIKTVRSVGYRLTITE